MKATSIRTRLLVVYMGILLVGFAGLTVIAGGQISSGAQTDYAQRLQNEIRLIAQGVSPVVDDYVDGRVDLSAVEAEFKEYETPVNGTLKLYPMQEAAQSSPRLSYRDMLEMETALRGQIVLVRRKSEAEEDTFYIAAPIVYNGRLQALVQLSVPARNLQDIITRRWLELALVFALVTGLAVLAALWLAQSIIKPLYTLREAVGHLSKGHLAHRIAYSSQDEIGEVARAFNEMARQVESMLEEQRAFASNASHELRTPLTTIRLRTEALRYETELGEPLTKRYVEEIDDEIVRLGNLMQDLTLLSRFDAGRAELGQDQVDMLRFAASLQQQMAQSAQDKQIQIILDLPDAAVLVNASLNHLLIVFRNILDNALKYTPVGGSVTWTIQTTDTLVCNTLHDTGRGIAAEHLPHVFERFYRVDKARSRETPGTGLGLALVKSIVEAYGGTITITSAGVDQGTTVSVSWPRRPREFP